MAGPDTAASPPRVVGAVDADGILPVGTIDLDDAVASSLAGLGACFDRSGAATGPDSVSCEQG